ncbi:MAG TPA: bifunctional diaminohydroxyphosphoribosylaminopyrimidine deaminase/5-amino-6-(5-phosphoribosylamino)uracil reductase RibD [Mycobacteriales bacterium]|nr:bifunctional diaminohydroxyphosphoribosylaminopyrimidine deaminase/5-amino-6-(5-phosphoribosylamino)uracil reductase RibD [Mycobacteriales bacterium]
MRRAAALGVAVLGTTSPNPPVGAVALDASGAVVGEGSTRPPGGAHAEVSALTAAAGRAHTVVTTLEPCAHTGRTGPCTQALLEAGVRRVVIGCPEPTAQAGGGAAQLRAAGVEVVEGVLVDEVARGALAGWLHRQRTGRPHVTWKYAAGLDGRSAARDGSSRWITGEAARADVHRLRAECDAVVIGIGTVLADDPALTARPDPGHQPLRVVVDSDGRTPGTAQVLDDAAPTLVVTHGPSYGEERTLVLDPAPDGRVDLAALLSALGERGVVNVLLEGGPRLAGAFVAAGLVDRVVGYIAPVLLGAGTAALQDAGVDSIDQAVRMRTTDVTQLGDDVRLTMERG